MGEVPISKYESTTNRELMPSDEAPNDSARDHSYFREETLGRNHKRGAKRTSEKSS